MLAVLALLLSLVQLEAQLEARTSVNSELTDLALGLHPLSNPAVRADLLTTNGLAAAQVAGLLHPLIGSLNITFPSTTVSPSDPSDLPPCDANCSLLEILARSARLSKLAAALRSSQLDLLLTTDTNITIFAPDNAAFDSLPDLMFEDLLANKTVLQSILLRHITRGLITSDHIPATETPLITGAGELVMVVTTEAATTITSHMASASIITPDILAVNGVVHVIDSVI